MSARLCTKCQVFLDNIGNGRRQTHHKIDAIEASVKEGCQLCELFLAGFSNEELLMLRAEEEGGCEMEIGLTPLKDNVYELGGQIIQKAGQFVMAYLNVTLTVVPGQLPSASLNL
jgi:hypothetical protein